MMADFESLWEFLNSQFARTVIASLAGAGLGAWTAQRIATRNKAQDDLVKELRTINLTATIAYGITDAFISVKKDNVKPMYDKWRSESTRRQEVIRTAPAGTVPEFEFDVDFKTMPPVKAGVEQLRQLMFGGIVLQPRAVALVNTLDRSVEQHSLMIQELNKLTEKFHGENLTGPQLAAVYFGLRVGTRIDDRYPTTLQALHMSTDDCIFFSGLLGDDLLEYGKTVAARLPERLRGKYTKATFDQPEREGLMPDPAEFPSWTTMFQTAPVLGLGIWTAEFEALALAQQ